MRLSRKSGKGFALSTAALDGADLTVCLDADGQHDPEEIPKVVQPIIESRADMVMGSRFLDAQARLMIPAHSRLGQSVLTLATNIGSSVKITDSQSGLRAFRKEAVNTSDYTATGMGMESEMVRDAVKSGLRIEEVPIIARYQGLDTSTLKPGSHGMTVLGSILREIKYEHPRLYFGVGGLVMTIVGSILGLYSVQQYITIIALPFGPTLFAVMLTALGILFVLVGLILNAISELMTNGRETRSNSR